MNNNINSLNFFISYSHKNMKYKEKLLISLDALKQSYNIESWHDGMIDAGGKIDESIRIQMNKSDIILLIITDNFLASRYCMEIELNNAMKRQRQGKCMVIPVMFQETVLSDILDFTNINRVPRDGKPIATGFKNQSQGCTRAVEMIKNMIDKNFPNCKKQNKIIGSSKKNVNNSSSKKFKLQTQNTTNRDSLVYMELYKNGKLSNIPVTQNIIDLIPRYFVGINNFITIMDQSLLVAKRKYSKLYNEYKDTIIPIDEKLNQFRYFLMDICAYTKTYITENVGIKVHFRVSKDNNYLGLIASTDDDNKIDLASDWTTKMTPIPIYEGLIYHSSKLNAPIIKSLNMKLNFKGKNDNIWKDYVTFTFPKFHTGVTPLISYCISIHKDYYKVKGNMLKILAYLNLGNVVEKYISKYYDICKKIDKNYNLESIINAL